MSRLAVAVVVALLASCHATESQMQKNPIRKVVNMLQMMSKKVSAEGEKAEELYEKYMCYCKTGVAALQKSIEDAGDKVPELEAQIKASTEIEAKLKSTLKEAESDRAAAKASMSEATAMREKEEAAFKAERDEYEANIAAIGKAVKAIEAGMEGNFLQTSAAQKMQKLAEGKAGAKLNEADRTDLLSFLSGKTGDGYAPASGEITGILKQMGDEMAAGLAEITKAEKAAIAEYKDLMTAKTKEVKALTASIEKKLEEIGDIGVKIAQMKNDLGDTAQGLEDDKKFLADLEKGCSTATADYEADQKMRNQELEALADTIKILNDDDALELFKKTLPAPSASFMQVQVTSEMMRQKALALLHGARKRSHDPHHRRQLDFMALALHGKKIGFDGVIKMIDDMIATLKKEQEDDDAKKEYCEKEFDVADDKKKALERVIKDLLTAIANAEEGISTTRDEIKALTAGIKALDKQVADATDQRKKENAEYKELMASDSAAKELLLFAKNRLNKFYNPKLYKPPPKQELSAEDRIVDNMSLMQLAKSKSNVAPPPPPETAKAYSKKSGESQGVIAMIDLLIADLEKEMTTAKTEEKDAQADYEEFLADSQKKRTEDSKTLTDKEETLAELETALEKYKVEKKSNLKELAGVQKYITALHAECDWLLQYFDVRKEARTGEIDALGKAKAVLSGADFSFVQTGVRRHLRNRDGVIQASA